MFIQFKHPFNDEKTSMHNVTNSHTTSSSDSDTSSAIPYTVRRIGKDSTSLELH